jgi:hypothetical protein
MRGSFEVKKERAIYTESGAVGKLFFTFCSGSAIYFGFTSLRTRIIGTLPAFAPGRRGDVMKIDLRLAPLPR